MEQIKYRGKIFKIVQTEQSDGRIFEVARRAPGVRLIIVDKTKKELLLTREYRDELNAWDYRLPGGKVFDTLEEYDVFHARGEDIIKAAAKKAEAEAAEEAGIRTSKVTFYKKSTLGATVEWDLFFFEVDEWEKREQQLEAGEQIETDQWFSYSEVEQMVLSGQIQEERAALVLLQWLKQNA